MSVTSVAIGLSRNTGSVGMRPARSSCLSVQSSSWVRPIANAGTNLRATIAYTVANATAGKVRVRVAYTVDGRSYENDVYAHDLVVFRRST